MSMDSADDLEYAEGLLGVAAELLRESLGHALGERIQGRIVALVAEWDAFCRPTCQAEGVEDDCIEGDCCGCPCHGRTQ